jgi:hypothetical protein
MTNRSSNPALCALAALVLCSTPVAMRARQISTPALTIQKSTPDPTKPLKGRFEVLHMLTSAIQVRSAANNLELRTFVYSDAIRNNMQKVLDRGGFQYGDKVEIWYLPGKDVALKIKGKPSKPL